MSDKDATGPVDRPGWVSVPREPTPEMLLKIYKQWGLPRVELAELYADMLAAAPVPVGEVLTAEAINKCVCDSGLACLGLAILPDNTTEFVRAVERACAEAWGVTLATGQEGGKDHG